MMISLIKENWEEQCGEWQLTKIKLSLTQDDLLTSIGSTELFTY